MVHSFANSLSLSRQHAEAPWWETIYKRAFPNFANMTLVRDDGWAQRGGIDRVITLRCGNTIRVEEKVREKKWDDILLERWSNGEKQIAGWIQKQLACDFVAYVFLPTKECHMLPYMPLRRAWLQNGRDWCEEYGEVRSENQGYTTVSVPVPINVLYAAINGAMLVDWGESS